MQKNKFCVIPLIYLPRVVRFIESGIRMVAVGGWREGAMGISV